MPGHRFQTAPTAPTQLRFIVRVNEFVLQRLKGSSLAVRRVQAAWAISEKRKEKKKTQCAISASLFAEMCSERICPHMQTLLRLLSVFVLVAVLHYSFFSVRTNVEAVICRLLTSFDYIIISQNQPPTPTRPLPFGFFCSNNFNRPIFVFFGRCLRRYGEAAPGSDNFQRREVQQPAEL